ncbi:MAG: hypothetical protein V1839_02570 [archaeon]
MAHSHESGMAYHSREYKLALFLFHAMIIEFATIFLLASYRLFHGLDAGKIATLMALPFRLMFTANLKAGINGMMIGITVASGLAIYFVLKQYDFQERPYFTFWATMLLMYIFANMLLFIGGLNYFPASMFVPPHF